MDWVKMKWATFTYNYCWTDYSAYIDGWIPKFSLMVPIIGYLILFNDEFVQIFEFKRITSNNFDGLSAKDRLHLLYFGLIFLGVSNFIYRVKRPWIFVYGENIIEFTKACLESMKYGDFLAFHQTIRREEHLTQDGKYYDSEWDGFVIAALNKGEGTQEVKRNGNWEDAKRQYGSLLRSILREIHFRNDITRRFWLSLCLALSTIGYICLIVPSADIFIKVIKSIFID